MDSETRTTLTRLIARRDRSVPVVFAGREAEFNLLRQAGEETRAGHTGLTMVFQGVPGVGKTALATEYAKRVSARCASEGVATLAAVPISPVQFNSPPAALLAEINRVIQRGSAGEWVRRTLANAVSLAADVATAATTKKRIGEFAPHGGNPPTLSAALEGHGLFGLGQRGGTTLVLLLDEAQTLPDTQQVRDNLQELHMGVGGAGALLACFGLGRTVSRLGDLGISRLARGHARTLDVLSPRDAESVVRDTLDKAFMAHPFGHGMGDGEARCAWIGQATRIVLSESACFPHHLANGCAAVAEVVLREGVGRDVPADSIREVCRAHKREYYESRLEPWENHTAALAVAFTYFGDTGVPATSLLELLAASDNRGSPVDRSCALDVVDGLLENGYVVERLGILRPAIPSLLSHFAEFRREVRTRDDLEKTLTAALPDRRGVER